MPPLLKERDVNQPAITSSFTKSPKEKVAVMGHKQEARKILPRKSARAAQLNIAREPSVSKDKDANGGRRTLTRAGKYDTSK